MTENKATYQAEPDTAHPSVIRSVFTMTIPTSITEQDGIHKEWYEQHPTLAELPEFIRHLLEDYGHDYGTICHAFAAAAVVTLRAMNDHPKAGITGFQGGAVAWKFWQHWMHTTGPLRMLSYENMLYPQYADDFHRISADTWQWLQGQARESLESKPYAHDSVIRHWQSIVNDVVPFGYLVEGKS